MPWSSIVALLGRSGPLRVVPRALVARGMLALGVVPRAAGSRERRDRSRPRRPSRADRSDPVPTP